MSYEKTKAECQYCGQRYMSKAIAAHHEWVCEENDSQEENE